MERVLLILVSIPYVYMEVDSANNMAVGPSNENDIFNSILFPNEVVSHRERRPVEWYKRNKHIPDILKDSSITHTGSVSLSPRLVGENYTISAILPGASSDSMYILRRRQDPSNGLSGFTDDGLYERRFDGAIRVPCVLLLNLTTSNVIRSFGNNTFYYPNAMVKDPEGNFWFSDAARHQVLRMNSSIAVPDLAIGRQFAPGKGKSRLCGPNDVAVTSKHVYVADGLCNNRVVLFNKTGGYITEFGKAPSDHELLRLNLHRGSFELPMIYINNPKAIAVDHKTDRLYIAENERSRVVIVKAGENKVGDFGTGIRYFRHPEMSPLAEGIALHPTQPFVFVLNSFNMAQPHLGFTFNTHDARFKGSWATDIRGFVRPRAIVTSADGSTVYVADATETKPERIEIFTATEYLRSRRNAGLLDREREKGQRSRLSGNGGFVNRNYYRISRAGQASTKGIAQHQLADNNIIYRSIYRRMMSNQGNKGGQT